MVTSGQEYRFQLFTVCFHKLLKSFGLVPILGHQLLTHRGERSNLGLFAQLATVMVSQIVVRRSTIQLSIKPVDQTMTTGQFD